MPTLKGTTVQLLVDGAPLPEYRVEQLPSADPMTENITCYVESRENRRFSISWEGSHHMGQISNYKLDGQTLARAIRDAYQSGRQIHIGPRASLDGTMRRPYVFGKVKLSEDEDETCHDEVMIKSLGTVSVELFEYTPGRKVEWRTIPEVATAADHSFSEKSKKASLAHVAGLAEAIRTDQAPSFHAREIAWEAKKPRLVFTWKYRSRDLLEAEGIVEPDAVQHSAVAAEDPRRIRKRSASRVVDVDVDEWAKASGWQPKKVKRESGTGIKREDVIDLTKDTGRRADGLPKFKPGEMITIQDDDD